MWRVAQGSRLRVYGLGFIWLRVKVAILRVCLSGCGPSLPASKLVRVNLSKSSAKLLSELRRVESDVMR